MEVAIAVSIWILALQLTRGGTRLRRPPWGMALGFGWLHGLGFAGALSEAGLPAGEVPLALLSFNLGIEAGQIAFIGVLIALARAVQADSQRLTERLALPAAYLIGSLATFWILDRSWSWMANFL